VGERVAIAEGLPAVADELSFAGHRLKKVFREKSIANTKGKISNVWFHLIPCFSARVAGGRWAHIILACRRFRVRSLIVAPAN
jgi:hypothetical protein